MPAPGRHGVFLPNAGEGAIIQAQDLRGRQFRCRFACGSKVFHLFCLWAKNAHKQKKSITLRNSFMHLRSSTTHIARPIASDDALPRLRGRWLLLVRAIWVVVAAISLGLFVVSVPVSFATRQGICAANACAGGRLNLEGVQALQALADVASCLCLIGRLVGMLCLGSKYYETFI
ncbi:MAG TPA: hypothetical protein VEO53_02310 [Candidatus Binatia bacterium]|nr:hypothetical protein [Candidatus Binatia bacterium]